MKTEFELQEKWNDIWEIWVKITHGKPRSDINFSNWLSDYFHPPIRKNYEDKDLERFAVNILKALKSKKLKP